MIDALTITGLIFKSILMILMSIGILSFGKLIAETPDMLERHGKRTEKTDIPYRHARIYVISFWAIYLIGSGLILLSGIKAWVIIGWVLTFSVTLFSGTILIFEMKIYNLMKKNCRELAGSLVA